METETSVTHAADRGLVGEWTMVISTDQLDYLENQSYPFNLLGDLAELAEELSRGVGKIVTGLVYFVGDMFFTVNIKI